METAKPIQYYLEIYRNEREDHPTASYIASTPFQTISVGDKFDYHSLEGVTPPGKDAFLQVKSVEHIIWDSKSHLAHKVMIVLKLTQSQR